MPVSGHRADAAAREFVAAAPPQDEGLVAEATEVAGIDDAGASGGRGGVNGLFYPAGADEAGRRGLRTKSMWGGRGQDALTHTPSLERV